MKYSPVTPALRALTALVVILLAPRAMAADGVWTNIPEYSSDNLYWSSSENWSGGTVADGANATATFAAQVSDMGPNDVTVYLDTSRTIGHLVFDGEIDRWKLKHDGGGATLTLAGNNPSITVGYVRTEIHVELEGNSGLVKEGRGKLELYATNTFSGGTTIKDGEVILKNLGGLGSGDVVLEGFTSLAFEATGTFANNLTVGTWSSLFADSAATTVTSDITLAGDNVRLLGGGGNSLVLSGVISGDHSIIKTQESTFTFSGDRANTYTGLTTVDKGTLVLAKTAGTTAILGDLAINYNDGGGFGTVRLDADEQISDSSAVTLDEGMLNLNGHTETIGSLASGKSSSSVILGDGGALTVGAANTSTTFAGVISGAGTLTKIGTGNFTLSGANTFTGGTTLNAGTLTLGSANALLNATGKLLVTGGSLNTSVANTTVGGDIEFTGGTLSINGADAGALTLAEGKNFTMSDGTIEFTLGTSFDQIISLGDGALSLTGSTINLTLGDGFDYYSYYALFSNFTTAHFNALTITGYDTLNYVASISNMGVLSFSASAVPEPSTYALLAGLGVLGIAMWRRRAVR